MSKIDPGPGYRLLRTGERLEDGDERFDMGSWRETSNTGCVVGKPGYTMCDYRRKIDPGPGFRLLEEGETIPPVYEWLDDVGEWRKHGTRAGVRYVHKAHGFCRTAADAAPYRPEATTVQNTTLPVPGSPEDKASLAELDSLIPAPKAVDIVAPWPEAVVAARILDKAGSDSTFLQWVADRLVHVHKDPEGADFVHRLRALAEKFPELPKPFAPNKYTRDLLALDGRRVPVDVYSVLAAFPVGNAAVDHALKKLLAPGQRGQKSRIQDLKEARASLDRAIQMEGG